MAFTSFGQTNAPKTTPAKEVVIPYTNGKEVFHICVTNPQMIFDDKKEYFWYTEFSKIKSTKGGSGGNLLHGNFKFYDENGNLRHDKNYYLGLLDGSEKSWDSLGNITSQAKYNKGDNIYLKFQNKEKYWVEFNGAMFTEGTTRKIYTSYNSIISEEKMLSNFRQHTKTFYDYSGKLKEEYTSNGIGGEYRAGKYTSYYENGKIEVDGQYYDGEYTNVQVGTWKWYKSDGTIDATEIYKAEIEKWDNGEIKVAGGYIFDNDNNAWLKYGEWRWYTDEGKYQSSKKYKRGIEVTE